MSNQIPDLSLSSPKINSYFNNTSDLAPVGELLYVHTHQISPNFLSEIEVIINLTSQKLSQHPSPKTLSTSTQLLALSERISTEMYEVSEKTAPQILSTLKDIYQVCTEFLNKSNPPKTTKKRKVKS